MANNNKLNVIMSVVIGLILIGVLLPIALTGMVDYTGFFNSTVSGDPVTGTNTTVGTLVNTIIPIMIVVSLIMSLIAVKQSRGGK